MSESRPLPGRDGSARLAPLLRAVFYALVLPWFGICLTATTRGPVVYALGVLGVSLVALTLYRLAPRLPGWLRGTEILLWNAVLALVLLEGATRTYLALADAPSWLEVGPDQLRYRLDPRSDWLGWRPNRLGFLDEEFTETKRPGVTRVVALGDSYLVGMVPYEENFVTLVDAALGDDVEIFNLGVNHMAVRQYLEILVSDGLRFAPDAVLLDIYIGNDIRPDPPRGLFSRWGSRFLTAVRRTWTVYSENHLGNRKTLERLFRLEADGRRSERAFMSAERHLAREWLHLQSLFRPPQDARMRRAWAETERALRELVDLCREHSIPVFATIAPDEVQVSQRLLREVSERFAGSSGDFDLGYPGRRLGARLEELGVPVLDLRDALVAAEREGPTYHLRGLHWNRHGNAVVAEAIAPWLASQLETLRSVR